MTDANGWRPIETAPRDGTWILVWDGEAMTTAKWFAVGENWELVKCGSWAEDGEVFPTHWQPLPGAPEAGE